MEPKASSMSKEFPIKSLAVVLPRYGKSLGGGAETLASNLAYQLASRKLVEKLEVWTTCALDHRTWENHFPQGESIEQGLIIRRFAVDERDLEVFIKHEIAQANAQQLSVSEQLDWLSQGVNSRALYQHIEAEGKNFDLILFAPYLFPTSFWGALVHPERSVIIPCLHDEHYAYNSIFYYLFSKVQGLIFNAKPEGDLAKKLYKIPDLPEKSAVVGMGFEPLKQLAEPEKLPIEKPYLLYSGRKEQGKNLDLLIRYFCEYREKFPETDLQLAMIGSGEVSFLDELPEAVIDLGFVSEEEKHALMKNAVALCQPSVNESFSIVLMEAWQHQTPVIVHADCAVTADHARTSGGGLYFANSPEFSAILQELHEDSGLRDALGRAGCEYVQNEYNWDAVVERFVKAITKFQMRSNARNEQNIAN